MAAIKPVSVIILVILGGVHGVQYFGKLIGKLSELHHGVSGEVYAVDSRTLYIKDFTYDGQGPAAYFYAGNTRSPGSSGIRLRDERGSGDVIRKYRKEGVTLTLPEGKTLNNIKIFYVWCEEFAVNFGDVKIPKNFDYPRPVKVDSLQGVHGVSSDNIVIVDAQTLLIPSFSYDGEAPDAKFWVGQGSKPSPQGIRVPDENGKELPLRRYDKKTIVITLPADLTVFDIGHFGVWCEAFTVDFGHVQIPSNLNVPPSLKMLGVSPQSKLNCEVLHDSSAFEVRWALAGDSVVVQLVSKVGAREYMSFGISGEDTSSLMINGDVAVAWINETTLQGRAVDYYLRDKSQCSGRSGSCPDHVFRENTNSIKMLNAATVNGYSIVTYQRPLQAQDEYDRTIYPNVSTPIIWAIGPLNERNEVSFHSQYLKKDQFLHFGRHPEWNCPAPEVEQPMRHSVVSQDDDQESSSIPSRSRGSERRRGQNQNRGSTTQISNTSEEPVRAIPTPAPASRRNAWTIPPIQCDEPEDGVFYAQMGPTGGKRGYPAITGHVGWGISWYINGLLIPVINVVRGKTYTFVIEGGSDPSIPAKYHPFYITDDPVGGYEHQSPAEKKNIRILAGARQAKNGTVYPTGTGRLCHWTQKGDNEADDFASFGAYQRTLELKCDQGEPGVIQWTPDEHTPDVVYYQCFTHRYLGWKINVLDTCDNIPAADEIREVSVPFTADDAIGQENVYYREEATVKPNSISNESLDDKVAYTISAKEDAIIVAPNTHNEMLPNNQPFTNSLSFTPNPYPFNINSIPRFTPYNQGSFYNHNPHLNFNMIRSQPDDFKPSPLIYSGLVRTPFNNDPFTSTTTMITTSVTTTLGTTTTTAIPSTTTSVAPTTTTEKKEYLSFTASDSEFQAPVIVSATKFTKLKPVSPLRTGFIKMPIASTGIKKPVRHIATLVRPSSQQFHKSFKTTNPISHPTALQHQLITPLTIIPSNKGSSRKRPVIVRPYTNSATTKKRKQSQNIHLPPNIFILTHNVPQAEHTLSKYVTNDNSHNINNLSTQITKTITTTQAATDISDGLTNYAFIYPMKAFIIKPQQGPEIHRMKINLEKGLASMLRRKDFATDAEITEPSSIKETFSSRNVPPMVRRSLSYSSISKRDAKNFESVKNIDEEQIPEESNKQISYLPPPNAKEAISSSSSDTYTETAPDVVVTYDGKKISGASLTIKLTNSPGHQNTKSMKTSEFIRTRPQSVPFKGELPPLDIPAQFGKPQQNVGIGLSRSLAAPFISDSTSVLRSSSRYTKLAPKKTKNSRDQISRVIRRKRNPHHSPEHSMKNEEDGRNASSILLKLPMLSVISIVISQILLIK